MMSARWVTIAIVLVIGYLIGAKYPVWAGKLGLV